jgi:hypothetical protein
VRRRDFLRAAAAAATTPAWLARAFADDAAPGRAALLKDAYARACAQGRPLLLFVVPADREQHGERGGVLGEWLQHAAGEAQEGLAQCAIACASIDEARKALPKIALPAGEPLMVLLEAVPGQPAAQAIAPQLPAVEGDRSPSPKERRAIDRAILARVACVSRAFLDKLEPDAGTRRARAERNAASMTEAERARMAEIRQGRGALGGRTVENAEVLRGATLLLHAAEENAFERARVRKLLRKAYLEAVRDADPTGASWADGTCPGCGLAYVPELSRKFLRFYTR